MCSPNEEQIRERAHQLWERAGQPEGREDEFWLEAERQLQAGDPTINADEKASSFTE